MTSLEPRGHPQRNHLCRVSSFFRFTATTKLNLRLLVTAISFFHAVVAVGVVVAIVFTARTELYHNPPQAQFISSSSWSLIRSCGLRNCRRIIRRSKRKLERATMVNF
ncbi:hypothetical protein YC2023_074251 [Brassica napus]